MTRAAARRVKQDRMRKRTSEGLMRMVVPFDQGGWGPAAGDWRLEVGGEYQAAEVYQASDTW